MKETINNLLIKIIPVVAVPIMWTAGIVIAGCAVWLLFMAASAYDRWEESQEQEVANVDMDEVRKAQEEAKERNAAKFFCNGKIVK